MSYHAMANALGLAVRMSNPIYLVRSSGFEGGWQDQLSNGGGCWTAPPITMSCLFWTCRRLGNLRTKKELGELIQAKDPSIVFLAKT